MSNPNFLMFSLGQPRKSRLAHVIWKNKWTVYVTTYGSFSLMPKPHHYHVKFPNYSNFKFHHLMLTTEDVIQHKDWYFISNSSIVYENLDALEDEIYDYIINMNYGYLLLANCRGIDVVLGFATDCPCGVWCRGLTTCLLHVDPPFGNRILNNSWAVGLTYWIIYLIFLCFNICNHICLDTSDLFRFYLLKYSLFFQVLLY